MARKPAAKKGVVRVNFKDVESRRTPPEGDYVLAVLEAKNEQSNGGNDQIVFTMEISKGEYKGQKLWFYCPLTENSLWKLHAWLTALGEEVPQDELDIDLTDLAGKELVGVLTHEVYQGKKKAKITDFASLSEYSGDLPGDDEKSSKKDKKKKKDKGSKNEPEAKSDKKAGKDKKSKDEPKADKSKKDKGGKKDKTPKVDADDVKSADEKSLKKLIKEHKLDVDLSDYKTLKKQAAAVSEALEEAGLLAD